MSILYKPASKEIKALATFNKVAKTSFANYLINNRSEAFSTRQHHTDENRYSFVNDPKGSIDFLFMEMKLQSDVVLQLNGPLVDLALKKVTQVLHFGMDYTKFFIDTSTEIEADKYGGECLPIDDSKGSTIYRTFVGVAHPFEQFEKSYLLCKPYTEMYKMCTEDVLDTIMDREIVILEDKGFAFIVGKPMFPGVNLKCSIGYHFMEYNGNNELFFANLLVVKEQIFNHQKYIGVKMF